MSTPSIQDQTRIPRLSKAWPSFAEKLAAALGNLQEDQYLILLIKRSNRFVQFAAQGAHGMRIETTSNHYLSKREQLNAQEIASLLDAGWKSPTGSGEEATPELDPDGSPNYYMDLEVPVSFDDVAGLTVLTLAEILRVPYPGFLEYEAFDEEHQALTLPKLGLKLASRKPRADNLADVPTLLKATLSKITGVDDIDFDDDGDIAIRFNSIAAFVRLNDNPAIVCIYSPILRDVEPRAELFERLNDFNANEFMMRFVYRNGAIWCHTHIPALPYVDAHMTDAFRYFCAVADGVDSLLKEEFGGTTAFAESMPSTMKQ